MKLNRILAIAVLALFLLSFLTYRESVERAERFERGQKLLANLDPDEIYAIEITKGETTTRLERGQDRFLVRSAGSYPAKNEAVNGFLRDLLELSLEKEVGKGEKLEQELGLAAGGEETLEVALEGSGGEEMVRFRVGDSLDESGGGSYVRRIDREASPIYLTSSRVYLSSSEDDFLDQELLNVTQDRIAAIRGQGYTLEETEGQLELTEVPAGKKASTSKVGQLKSLLSYLRFTKHHRADAPEVAGLHFDRELEVELDDDSGYRLAVAESGEKHYLRIEGYHNVRQLAVSAEDTEEQNQANAEILERADEIQRFNQLHGTWIYEVAETTAEKVRYEKADLLEEA